MWTDLPKMDEPLPKFLDDDQAAKFMAAAVRLDPQRRLIIELLARTGLRVTEFCELTHDAIVTMNETNWLRVPVGKLHTDRYVPLLPHLVELHREWLAWNGPNTTGRLISNKGRPLNRSSVSRTVAACARIAGIGHVHPHQLRHTLATQSINNGMSLEAIAQMLGHRSMRMTLVYARIADRTVAEEYFAVSEKVEALYDRAAHLPADTESAEMLKLRQQMNSRMLGNRPLRPPRRDGLSLRVHLRVLHILRDHHRIQTHAAAPTRRHRRQGTNRPPKSIQWNPRPTRERGLLTTSSKPDSRFTGKIQR